MRAYKNKGVWPPQSIKTTTCAAQSTTTFYHSQKPVHVDDSPQFLKERMKRIQQIVGYFLYYGWVIDITIIKTLNILVTQQSAPTENTDQDVKHFLDYYATHPDAKI